MPAALVTLVTRGALLITLRASDVCGGSTYLPQGPGTQNEV